MLGEPLVGTCTQLEKPYFRTTGEVVASSVRPLHILRQTLQLLERKWREEKDYPYVCDQFRSMRQDLSFQHIRNDFTVKVYETNTRIALEKVLYFVLLHR